MFLLWEIYFLLETNVKKEFKKRRTLSNSSAPVNDADLHGDDEETVDKKIATRAELSMSNQNC